MASDFPVCLPGLPPGWLRWMVGMSGVGCCSPGVRDLLCHTSVTRLYSASAPMGCNTPGYNEMWVSALE